jgi:Zn-dependent protease
MRLPFLPTAAGLTALIFARSWYLHWRRRGLRLDSNGIAALGTGQRLDWPEIARIRLATELRPTRAGRHAILRFVSLETGTRDRSIRFAELQGQGRVLAPDIEDVADAPLVLGVVAERRGVLEGLLGRSRLANEQPAVEEPGRALPQVKGDRGWGLVALLLKLGPKLTGFFAGGFKLVKPGSAMLTLGVYSALFSWRFALALMAMIFWHEYGHVRAMQRIGHPVRGIYFVPFLGGLAVHNAPIANRWHRVYVDLNGPAFGLYLTLIPFALSWVAGERWPWLYPLTAWWALINLFNLMPILPLDGGRTLSAIAFSIHSRLGAILVVLGLVGGGLLAMLANQGLLVLVTLVGVLELVAELRARTRRQLLESMTSDRLDFSAWWRLVRATRPPVPGGAAAERIAAERAAFEQLMALATGRSMNQHQVALGTLCYVGLTLALGTILVVASRQAGNTGLLELFR